MNIRLITLVVTTALACASICWAGHETVGRTERLDPALDKLIAPDAKIEKLATGFEWSEGPVWINADGGYLLFSDVVKNTVHKWSERGGLSEFLKPSGMPAGSYTGKEPGSNGLTVDTQGRVILCQHGARRVARLEADRSQTLLADKYDGKRLNSPNDLVYNAKGDLFFTDPPYGLSTGNDKAPEKELDFNGVYRLGHDGTLTLLTKEMTRPNGIALSPDEKTLYVAQSDGKMPVIMAFDVTEAGVTNGRVFFDAAPLKKSGPGSPDGLKVDRDGNVFCTGPGGVLVISKDGKHLGTIRPSDKEPTANCAFGDDGSTLYMTNDSTLCRIKLLTKGKGF